MRSSQRPLGVLAIFHFYPADIKDPNTLAGKRRLFYKTEPLTFIAQETVEHASISSEDIVTIEPTQAIIATLV